MSAVFSGQEIIEFAKGTVVSGSLPANVKGSICTDSRQLKPNDWFLALAGDRFDGHDFIGKVAAAKPAGCIVNHRRRYAFADANLPIIAVDDTLTAYHSLAKAWLRKVDPHVVAITGSSGKTTTKEMIYSVLSSGFTCHKSQANENNQIGLPKTILSMPENTDVVVLEMAMRGRGQIALLAATAWPDIAVITNAQMAHVELLGTHENIIAAKCEILEALDPSTGLGIIGAPTDKLLQRAKQVYTGKTLAFGDKTLSSIETDNSTTRFTVDGGTTVFSVRAHGLPLLQDAWCAVECARALGMKDDAITRGLAGYVPPQGRGHRLTTKQGAVIVDESYNANPDSVKAAVTSFIESLSSAKANKYVVLGDMAELGDCTEALHRELGVWMTGLDLQALYTVGTKAEIVGKAVSQSKFEVICCSNWEQVQDSLRDRLNSGTYILVKGSHSAGLDRLVTALVDC